MLVQKLTTLRECSDLVTAPTVSTKQCLQYTAPTVFRTQDCYSYSKYKKLQIEISMSTIQCRSPWNTSSGPVTILSAKNRNKLEVPIFGVIIDPHEI